MKSLLILPCEMAGKQYKTPGMAQTDMVRYRFVNIHETKSTYKIRIEESCNVQKICQVKGIWLFVHEP